jgi:glycosyltransferase involved in cell wall biosynthesis
MKLFYFATDTHPSWRVDLTELFSKELAALGVRIDWSLRREKSGIWEVLHRNGERIYLPLAITGIPLLTPIVRRVGELLGEIGLLFKFLLGERYDVIQVRDDRYTAALVGWFAARIRGSKFTYWVSFPFPENDFEKAKLSRGVKQQLFRIRGTLTKWWLYKFVLHKADHVFVQSERMRMDIAAFGVDLAKMTAVPMGVPPRLIEWRKTAQSEIDANSVVYLGSLARSRRLEMILTAYSIVLKQCPNARLYMVGRGDTVSDHHFLEDECRRIGVEEGVRFTGFVPMEQAWEMASKAAVCLSPIMPIPIFMVASPTKLYEYLALGRPVVANEQPEQSATLAESGAGLSVAWSAEDFAAAIIHLLKHPAEAEEMGRKGPAWVDGNCSYDRIAAGVYQQYQSVLSGAKP